jgi:hypothetical protein
VSFVDEKGSDGLRQARCERSGSLDIKTLIREEVMGRISIRRKKEGDGFS